MFKALPCKFESELLPKLGTAPSKYILVQLVSTSIMELVHILYLKSADLKFWRFALITQVCTRQYLARTFDYSLFSNYYHNQYCIAGLTCWAQRRRGNYTELKSVGNLTFRLAFSMYKRSQSISTCFPRLPVLLKISMPLLNNKRLTFEIPMHVTVSCCCVEDPAHLFRDLNAQGDSHCIIFSYFFKFELGGFRILIHAAWWLCASALLWV